MLKKLKTKKKVPVCPSCLTGMMNNIYSKNLPKHIFVSAPWHLESVSYSTKNTRIIYTPKAFFSKEEEA